MAEEIQGYKLLPELISRSKMDTVFGMVGGTNARWLAQGVHAGQFNFVRTRHEASAVHAATGYSRATNSVPICTVTRGPGFTNAITALVAAARTHVPLLLFVGESPPTKATLPTAYVQSIDQRGLTSLCGVGFHHVLAADDLPRVYSEALSAAHFNGLPQVVSIADGVMNATVPLEDAAMEAAGTVPSQTGGLGDSEPNAVAFGAAVRAIEQAERPLILAGRGAVLANVRELLSELADLIGANVASTLAANRFFSGHPRDLGVCGDLAPPPARDCIKQADLVLAVGASLNAYTTSNGSAFPHAQLVRIEVDHTSDQDADADLVIQADAAHAIRGLTDAWRANEVHGRSPWGNVPTWSDLQAACMDVDLHHDPSRGVDPRDVYVALDRQMPSDRIVVTDGGRVLGGVLPSLVNARDANSWMSGNAFAALGQGLGLAVGAAAACPERPVVLFCGDGAFALALEGLDAVRMNDLNLTVVIMNDEMYGSEAKYLTPLDLPLDTVTQSLPDVPVLAQAMGGSGIVIDTREKLFSHGLSFSGLEILDVRVDHHVDVRHAFSPDRLGTG